VAQTYNPFDSIFQKRNMQHCCCTSQ